jgi:L-ascorbate metabolism protein UlaG (beta-lactamase superfamily)
MKEEETIMQITWLGHAGFRIEIAGQVLLVDPWITGNPMFPAGREDAAVNGATHILITHAHGDHTMDTVRLSKAHDLPVICVHELSEIWAAEGVTCQGMGKGGTQHLGDVAVTMVNAVHSSSLDMNGVQYAGGEAGYMIAGEGHTIYVTGDTDIMADMEWMGELHDPDIGILCAGGHYTMDMKRAAWAAKRYFNFKSVIPCHFKTFGLLEQSADAMVAALPGVDVRVPEVLVPMAW